MFCVSKTRGVSSPCICYRLGKISKYIFTTGYANVTAYKKRACSPPIVAKSGGRFDLSLLKKEEGQNENSAEIKHDTTPPPDLRVSVISQRVVPVAGDSVFAALRRDKAGGGTRQRKREAGGTPGGVSPCKKNAIIPPHCEQSFSKKEKETFALSCLAGLFLFV